MADWKGSFAPTTVYHRVGVLRRLLKLLELHGAPPCASLLPRVKTPRPRPVIAQPGQIETLLRLAPTWMKLFIILCWQTALRFSETLEVKPSTHNREKRTITIRTKGGKVRTIPTTPDVETLLAAAGDTTGQEDVPYIWIHRGRTLHKNGITSAWWDLCGRAGITNLHPHDLRRTTATHLYAVSKDLRAVQQFLGHDNLASTMSYLAPLTEEQLGDLHRLLNFHAKGPIQ